MLDRMTAPLVRFMERYYPDVFLFIIIITLITFPSAWWLTDYPPRDMLLTWGNSLSSILGFVLLGGGLAIVSYFYESCLQTPLEGYGGAT